MHMMDARCWRCAAVVAPKERFCAACGAGIGGGTSVSSARPMHLDLDAVAKISKARKWLLAVSILTLISGFIFYGLQRSEVEKKIREAAAQTAHIDPATREALLQKQIGITWAQVEKHDRGQVK